MSGREVVVEVGVVVAVVDDATTVVDARDVEVPGAEEFFDELHAASPARATSSITVDVLTPERMDA